MGGERAGVFISLCPASGVTTGWPSTLAKCHPGLPLSGGPLHNFLFQGPGNFSLLSSLNTESCNLLLLVQAPWLLHNLLKVL